MRKIRDAKGRFAKDMRFYERLVVGSMIALVVGFVYETMPKEVLAVAPEVTPAIEEVKVEAITIEELIYQKAAKYGTYGDRMYAVVRCETSNTFRTDIQSGYRYKRDRPEWGVKKNDRELSYGLAQFHIPSGLTTADGKPITEEMAKDPEVALDAMAYHFSIGNAKYWSCYNLLGYKKPQ